MNGADVILLAIGGAFTAGATFWAWALQHKIVRREKADDERDKKLDALVGVPAMLAGVSVQVDGIAKGLNDHLLRSEADHTRLTDHLQYHRV